MFIPSDLPIALLESATVHRLHVINCEGSGRGVGGGLTEFNSSLIIYVNKKGPCFTLEATLSKDWRSAPNKKTV